MSTPSQTSSGLGGIVIMLVGNQAKFPSDGGNLMSARNIWGIWSAGNRKSAILACVCRKIHIFDRIKRQDELVGGSAFAVRAIHVRLDNYKIIF